MKHRAFAIDERKSLTTVFISHSHRSRLPLDEKRIHLLSGAG